LTGLNTFEPVSAGVLRAREKMETPRLPILLREAETQSKFHTEKTSPLPFREGVSHEKH